MQAFAPFAYFCVLPMGLAIAVSAFVIVRWRERMQWRKWEWFSLALPVAIWWALMNLYIDVAAKSLTNLYEGFVIALAVPLCVAIRAFIGARIRPSVASRGLAWTLVAVAIGVYLLVPALPE